MSCKKVYVAATSQHIGKTTSTLGLVRALKDAGHSVAYCKPVGQKFIDLGDLRADKDALLFSKVSGFTLDPDIHSPVILGKGATTAYLDNPEAFPFRERILKADEILCSNHEIIVYEGTGHPGVGSVVGLSNADVAKMLGAPVLMVVQGGVGSTLDKLNLSLSLFREQNVEILGVIVNKVIPEKMDMVKHYVGKALDKMGLSLLGVLPYDKTLMYPIMASVRRVVDGKVLFNEDNLNNRIEEILPASLIEADKIDHFANILLVSSIKRIDKAIHQIRRVAHQKKIKELPISGIILTGEDSIEKYYKIFFKEAEYIESLGIPVITTQFDTLGAVIKINRIEVKINIRTPWKSDRAVELIKEHVDLDRLIKMLE
ncbi:MAG: AAA family ATPase [Saprospiraceae bacterium]|nr:AAA family ATPase [Saprospiraceae bacterium]MCB9325562.1 AAA family ATPase [Lewinellaceae bacterium]